MKSKFKVGDRVVVSTIKVDRWQLPIGMIGLVGTVCATEKELPILKGGAIAVEFDSPIEDGHSCTGFAKPGYGHYLNIDHIKHLNSILSVKQWMHEKAVKEEKLWHEETIGNKKKITFQLNPTLIKEEFEYEFIKKYENKTTT